MDCREEASTIGQSTGWRVVAYYTRGTPYEKESKTLIASLEYFSIPYTLYSVASQGSWELNCGLKPKVLRQAFLRHDILYLDVDAVVKREIIFPEIQDIGVHFFKGKELLSGTIYLKNNQNVRNLVQEWCDEQDRNPREWDQRNLQNVLKRSKVKVTDVGPEHVKIFDKMPGVDPIIQHNQASRRFKRKVDES